MPGEKNDLTYKSTGVDYSNMDPFKVEAQLAAATTSDHLKRFGFSEVPWSRGESAFLIKTPFGYLSFVVEGLGTKSLVADELAIVAAKIESLTGKTFYDNIAQCNAAMAFNDLITVGALPIAYGQYLAVGNSDWFDDKERRSALIEGTRKACALARCAWGGGETPTLKGIIVPGTADLAGATMGYVSKEEYLINPANIEAGDSIIMIESSGIHANGLTLARKIAENLQEGYLTKLFDGRTYGETLLDPTLIYVSLVEDCLEAGVNIHYAVNITGHGWRKLMRATNPFTYVIEKLPTERPIFEFIQEHGPVSNEEAYGNLNMSAGFALYVKKTDASKVIGLAERLGFKAFEAGYIEEGEKRVIITPKNLEFAGSTLAVR